MGLRPPPQLNRPLQEPPLLRLAELLDHLPDAGVPFRPVDSIDAHHFISVLRASTAHCPQLHSTDPSIAAILTITVGVTHGQ